MKNEPRSFGQLALGAPCPGSLIDLEVNEGKAELFAGIDSLLANVTVRGLKGEVTVKVQRGRHADEVLIDGLSRSEESVLDDLFAVEHQHLRGAWFLPERVSLKCGLVNLPSTFARHPRFATRITWEERARVGLARNPAGVFIWAILEPLFEQLFAPFELRGRLVGTKSREDQLAAWVSADEIVSALGLDVHNELAVMRYGGSWSRLRAAEQLNAKQRLLGSLAAQASEHMAGRYRAYRLLPLIVRYYSKAKNGRAKRVRVLTPTLEKTLTGFFGGDWLRFLGYLGEQPHPDEEIVMAVPEPKLFVGSTRSAAAVAAEMGVAVEEVERALSTYWDTTVERAVGATSPVGERVSTLGAFWEHFDAIHSRQALGMPSLGALVEEGRGVQIGWEGPDWWYSPRLYRKLLPNELVDEIERLWASTMLPKWPNRIVSEISPHALMADAFGPSLRFWHGCALTAWLVCEGPTSRTMAGLPAYHQDDLAELERLRCPVDPALFAELREAGRSEFEYLRDIITRYRRKWTEQYGKLYLRARWQSELREAGRLYSQMIAEKGKPPTAKQFARHAATATNHWFGGDLSAFHAAIGEKSPVHPVRVCLMPADRLGFAKRVFEVLGGRPFDQAEEQDRHTKLGWLAEESLHFIQLAEALGRPPGLREFGAEGFEYRAPVLAPGTDEAWGKYTRAIEAAKRETAAVLQQPGMASDPDRSANIASRKQAPA